MVSGRLGAYADRPGFTVGVVSGGHFLSHFYLLTMPPLFPLLVDDFAINNTQLGLTVSVMYLALFVFQIPAGELVDRVGAKRVFVAGTALVAAGTMLIGGATSYPLLLAFGFLAGVGQAAFHPADYALLDAVTPGEAEGKSFGVHTFAGFVGFAAAPPVVGGLGILYGWQAALVAVGAVGLLYALFAHATMGTVYLDRMAEVEEGADGDGNGGEPDEGDGGGVPGMASVALLRNPAILAMFAFFVVITFADLGIQSFTTVFLVEGFGYAESVGNAALTSFLALTAVFVLVGGELADRHDAHWVIVLSLTAAAVSTWAAIEALAGVGPWVAVASWGASGAFFGLALPARDRVVNAISDADATGTSFGIVYTGLPLGGFVAPAFIGAVIDATTVHAGFALNPVFFLGSAGVVLAAKLWIPE